MGKKKEKDIAGRNVFSTNTVFIFNALLYYHNFTMELNFSGENLTLKILILLLEEVIILPQKPVQVFFAIIPHKGNYRQDFQQLSGGQPIQEGSLFFLAQRTFHSFKIPSRIKFCLSIVSHVFPVSETECLTIDTISINHQRGYIDTK
jgi:hypothetical protein